MRTLSTPLLARLLSLGLIVACDAPQRTAAKTLACTSDDQCRADGHHFCNLKTLLCEACDGPCPVPDASNVGQVDADVADATEAAADGGTESEVSDGTIDAPYDVSPPADVSVATLPECVTATATCKDQCESECGGAYCGCAESCKGIEDCTSPLCYCDDLCASAGDCCPDKAAYCPDGG
jgi:hypothetical protein